MTHGQGKAYRKSASANRMSSYPNDPGTSWGSATALRSSSVFMPSNILRDSTALPNSTSLSRVLSSNVQNKRLAATRVTMSAVRFGIGDDEFQACKKMGDKELSERIKLTPGLGKVQDHYNGQHLIHWCVATDKPLSVIAICTAIPSVDEMNVKDSRGRTPLHMAVIAELEFITSVLLNLGANPNIMDGSNLLPLHHAASMGNTKILKQLMEKCDDLNVGGDGGYTALHFAAAADHPKCVEMLLQKKCNMLVKSNNGTYPIHTAAKSGSAGALEALVKGAESHGIDHRLLLSLKDREGQLPIHNAVNNGAAEAVIVCLKYGASLLSEKDSGSTPVHYAAKQGNLDLLKTMSAFNPEAFSEALQRTDLSGRTPLHWASMFNHHQVVKYLIDSSSVNTFDFNYQTPLLSAASSGCWESLAVLLAHKDTNTEVIDQNHRNALHQAVIQGIDLEKTWSVWKNVRNINRRCNEQDKTGSTPLHYATWNGKVADVKALLSLGARINMKNKLRQNPFHIACRNGCYDVCLLLLNDKDGSRLKNEQDDTGLSPLHIAASRGYTNIVNILLQRGAVISKSNSMSTALHLAAAGGFIPCVHSLLSVHIHLLDMEDIDGNTALHLAATNKHGATVGLLLRAGAEITYNACGKCFYDDALAAGCRDVLEVCVMHERWDEILSVFSQYHGQLILGLIQYLPNVCLMALDRCVRPSSNEKHTVEYSVTYNFRYLQLGDEYTSFAKAYKLKSSPLLPIEMMLHHNRDECLRHELIAVYLQQKWKSYGRVVNFLDICIYCLFMGSLTMFVVTHEPLLHYHTTTKVERQVYLLEPVKFKGETAYIQRDPFGMKLNVTDWEDFDFNKLWFPPEATGYHINAFSKICLLIVCAYSATLICKDLIQMVTLGLDYLKDVFLYLELMTYAASLYFAIPFLLGYSTHTQWNAASIAIFLSWFNFLVLCQRFQMVGLYIVMYIQIMKTLLQILFIFLVLMIAFGLSFYILQSREIQRTNENPWLSMYRTLILLFEIDYVTTVLKPYFDGRSETMHFPYLAFFFMALFLLFMPLLLVNLMIGLAVGDIQSVLRYAHQQKLFTQVDFHGKLERKLPFLKKLTPEILTVKPNAVDYSFKTWLMYFLGMKAPSVGKGEASGSSYGAHDRLLPITKSLADLQREISLVKRNMLQIMHKLGVSEAEYGVKHPFDDSSLGYLIHHSVER
ncbi:transient receptor potential cation channel subfamily A member 1-like [Elysia marginata]|uniref:Transient receptor potential cation channel subfamily A member 1-like n=1 Tax=Elysia marginata TaxID=1093978 RepID=A0AAV4ET30_9GAST|nr:transient receptor potential cation channel subfamily A member 1-like [Elysia marginata]